MNRRHCAILTTALLASSVWTDALAARSREAGIGIALAEPTAVDLKLWSTRPFALNLGVGVGFRSHFALYADFEFALEEFPLGRGATSRLYLGPGLGLSFSDGLHYHRFRAYEHGHVHLDLGAPFGWEVDFRFPLNLFVEIRPTLDLAGHPGALDVGAQVGARYRF